MGGPAITRYMTAVQGTDIAVGVMHFEDRFLRAQDDQPPCLPVAARSASVLVARGFARCARCIAQMIEPTASGTNKFKGRFFKRFSLCRVTVDVFSRHGEEREGF